MAGDVPDRILCWHGLVLYSDAFIVQHIIHTKSDLTGKAALPLVEQPEGETERIRFAPDGKGKLLHRITLTRLARFPMAAKFTALHSPRHQESLWKS